MRLKNFFPFNKDKKGQVFDQLGSLAVGVVTLAIILVVTFLILAEAKTQAQSIDGVNATGGDGSGNQSSHAWNSTGELQSAVSDIPGWVPIVIVTVIGAILLSLVLVFRARSA